MNYQNSLSIAGNSHNTTHSKKSGSTPASKFAREKLASSVASSATSSAGFRAGSRVSRAARIGAEELEKRFSFQSYSDDAEVDLVCPGAAQRALFDKRLLEQLYEQVAMRGGLETRDLRLLAHNGVVTIIGTVSDRAMRAQISTFLRECSPVKTVINRLKVRDDHATSPAEDTAWQQQDIAA
jgi:osmotically-inducible protein OsmY